MSGRIERIGQGRKVEEGKMKRRMEREEERRTSDGGRNVQFEILSANILGFIVKLVYYMLHFN